MPPRFFAWPGCKKGEVMPVFITVKKKNGELIENVRIEDEVCRLPGFIAVNNYGSIVYMSISDISEIIIEEKDKNNIYNFIPPIENRQKG